MREYILSAARHIAGAAIGAIASFLASQGLGGTLDPDTLLAIHDGILAITVAAGLIGYALAEKALKPVVRRIFGSEGTA